jgi:hypothetical protein
LGFAGRGAFAALLVLVGFGLVFFLLGMAGLRPRA